MFLSDDEREVALRAKVNDSPSDEEGDVAFLLRKLDSARKALEQVELERNRLLYNSRRCWWVTSV